MAWAALAAVIVVLNAAPVGAVPAEPPRNLDYFLDQAVRFKPSVHDIGERIRIAKGIDPEHLTEFTGIHEGGTSSPGDSEDEDEDSQFREEAGSQLKAEIRMAYAEVAAARGEKAELRLTSELFRQMVATATTLYANGKIDQAQVLKAQIEWERLEDGVHLLEKREKIFSVQLNVLTGDSPDGAIPPLEPLKETVPFLPLRQLAISYKSRRFLALFQQFMNLSASDLESGAPEKHGSHDDESLRNEADAFVEVARLSLDDLAFRARRLRTALIPRAEQAHKARLEAYKTGRLDFPALLDGIREWSDLRKEYWMVLGEIHMLTARIEFLTGVELGPEPPKDALPPVPEPEQQPVGDNPSEPAGAPSEGMSPADATPVAAPPEGTVPAVPAAKPEQSADPTSGAGVEVASPPAESKIPVEHDLKKGGTNE
jgi:hypothetical protein